MATFHASAHYIGCALGELRELENKGLLEAHTYPTDISKARAAREDLSLTILASIAEWLAEISHGLRQAGRGD